jgi:hypothetical protein
MAEINHTFLLLKNLTGILEEFAENYPIWSTLSEFERLDFDTEWCNAVAQYEMLSKESLSGEPTQQFDVITEKLKAIKSKLVELKLLVPEGI